MDEELPVRPQRQASFCKLLEFWFLFLLLGPISVFSQNLCGQPLLPTSTSLPIRVLFFEGVWAGGSRADHYLGAQILKF